MNRRLPLRRRRPADPIPGAEPVPEPALPLPPEATAVHTPVPVVDGDRPDPVQTVDPDAPAGLEPAPVAPAAPSFRERGRLRRRLRYLRRVRELGFRDLGGLAFDLHRFDRHSPELIAGKLAALGAVDGELRALEAMLGDREELVILREAGIAACVRCAALHGSDARFCPHCGLALRGAPMPIAAPARDTDPAPAAPSPPAS